MLPPLQGAGARPFLIEAAWQVSAGHLRCVVSALRGRSPTSPAACEVFVISLDTPLAGGVVAASGAGGVAAQELFVANVQLLHVRSQGPLSTQAHCLLMNPSVPGQPPCCVSQSCDFKSCSVMRLERSELVSARPGFKLDPQFSDGN